MFKKLAIFILICGMFTAGATMASAANYNLVPNPNDLYDLNHQYYYRWGINLNLAANEKIISAQLSIKNINNWQVENNDILYIHLLDAAPTLGVTQYYDNEGGGDNFANWSTPHVFLTSYTDPNDMPGPAENFLFNFTSGNIQMLTQYLANDQRFALGFDPDCHYFNDGVKLKIQTTTIPEPASMLLMASGLLGGFGLRRKRAV